MKAMNKKTKEIWKPIPGFKGYFASNLGRTKSSGVTLIISRIERSGERKSHLKRMREKILRPSTVSDRKGWLFVYVGVGKTRVKKYIHRAVWEAFHGPIDGEMQINHLDRNPQNNHLDNLEKCTRLENMRHSARAGSFRKSHLTDLDILVIRKSVRKISRLARMFRVDAKLISEIKKRRAYAYIEGSL